MHQLILTFSCNDTSGIVHAVTGAIVGCGGNITELQQFTSLDTGRFFMRVSFDHPSAEDELRQGLQAVADRIGESTRAVYSQFASMAELMGALGARGFQLVADLVNAVPVTDDPLADLVEVGAVAFREFAVTRPQLFRITFHQISVEITRQPEAVPALVASYESLASRFARAIDAGRLPERPLIEYAFAFHSFTSGLAAKRRGPRPR